MTSAPPRPAATGSAPQPGARRRRPSRAGYALLLAGLGAATVLRVLLAVGAGPVSIPLAETVRIVGHHLAPTVVGVPADRVLDQIVWDFRAPRSLLGAIIGAGLALVGATLQATVRNPLAYLFQAGYSFLILIGDPRRTQGVLFWLLGSLGSASWSDLGVPALAVALGCAVLRPRCSAPTAAGAGSQ